MLTVTHAFFISGPGGYKTTEGDRDHWYPESYDENQNNSSRYVINQLTVLISCVKEVSICISICGVWNHICWGSIFMDSVVIPHLHSQHNLYTLSMKSHPNELMKNWDFPQQIYMIFHSIQLLLINGIYFIPSKSCWIFLVMHFDLSVLYEHKTNYHRCL